MLFLHTGKSKPKRCSEIFIELFIRSAVVDMHQALGGRMKEKKDERMLNHFVWLYDGRKRN